MSLGLRPTSLPSGILIHPTIWPQQTWAENWGLHPFLGARAGSPSNTVWPGSKPTCTPSYMLIHPTVWPQYTNITERQDRTDNGIIAYGEPFYKRSPKIDETNRPVAHCILSTQHLFGDAILLDHRVSTFIGRRRRRRLVLPEWL